MSRRLRAVPDLTPFDEFIEAIPNRYARCRAGNHWWDALTVDILTTRGRLVGYQETEQCDRCGGTRTRVLDAHGFIVKQGRRTYADGYLATGFTEGTTVATRKAAARLRVMRDATVPAAKRRRGKGA